MEANAIHPAHLDLATSSNVGLGVWATSTHLIVQSDTRFVGVPHIDGIARKVAVADLVDRLRMAGHNALPHTLRMPEFVSAGHLDLEATRTVLKKIRPACGPATNYSLRTYEVSPDAIVATNTYVLAHTPNITTGLNRPVRLPLEAIDEIVASDSEGVEVSTNEMWVCYEIDGVLRGHLTPRGVSSPLTNFADAFAAELADAQRREVNRVEFARMLREIEPRDDVKYVPDEYLDARPVDADIVASAVRCLGTKMIDVYAKGDRFAVSNDKTTVFTAARRY